MTQSRETLRAPPLYRRTADGHRASVSSLDKTVTRGALLQRPRILQARQEAEDVPRLRGPRGTSARGRKTSRRVPAPFLWLVLQARGGESKEPCCIEGRTRKKTAEVSLVGPVSLTWKNVMKSSASSAVKKFRYHKLFRLGLSPPRSLGEQTAEKKQTDLLLALLVCERLQVPPSV